MSAVFLTRVVPLVRRHLAEWRARAETIPDPELKKQALASIRTKTFHCDGGGVYALLAGRRFPEAIRFIVAYQTISDYLDNLCDRGDSTDARDFRCLHRSMLDALTVSHGRGGYYACRPGARDGGYLEALVLACQEVLSTLPLYYRIAPALQTLEGYYAELQEHKHVGVEERVTRLQEWHRGRAGSLSDISWFEFSASAGSTLGIFYLVSSALGDDIDGEFVNRAMAVYFPWVQGLHILLDYFVDQDEDRQEGDLNFCSFYESDSSMVEGLVRFFAEAEKRVASLPLPRFHRLVCSGLLALYLADRKVHRVKRVKRAARAILGRAGWAAWCFFPICWLFRRWPGKN